MTPATTARITSPNTSCVATAVVPVTVNVLSPKMVITVGIRNVRARDAQGKMRFHAKRPCDPAKSVARMNSIWKPQTNIVFELVPSTGLDVDHHHSEPQGHEAVPEERVRTMKLDADEKEILDSVERGEWRPARATKRAKMRYSGYAKATFRKDRRLNIRISTKDLVAFQKRALEEGLPYQTLIASLLHKYASGRLREA